MLAGSPRSTLTARAARRAWSVVRSGARKTSGRIDRSAPAYLRCDGRELAEAAREAATTAAVTRAVAPVSLDETVGV